MGRCDCVFVWYLYLGVVVVSCVCVFLETKSTANDENCVYTAHSVCWSGFDEVFRFLACMNISADQFVSEWLEGELVWWTMRLFVACFASVKCRGRQWINTYQHFVLYNFTLVSGDGDGAWLPHFSFRPHCPIRCGMAGSFCVRREVRFVLTAKLLYSSISWLLARRLRFEFGNGKLPSKFPRAEC